MADTKRSRATILSTVLDTNDNYGITAQDLRDFAVSVIPEERAEAGDHWSPPSEDQVSAGQGRGWTQVITVAEAVTAGQVLTLNASGEYELAGASALPTGPGVCMALAAASAAATTSALFGGVAFFSGVFSGFVVGRPVYLASGTAGGVTQTQPTNAQPLGLAVAAGIVRFKPQLV